MNKFLLLIALPCLSLAGTVSCASGTLADYVALGSSGCISDLGILEYGFSYSSPSTAAAAASVDLIQSGPDHTVSEISWPAGTTDFTLSWYADTSASGVDVIGFSALISMALYTDVTGTRQELADPINPQVISFPPFGAEAGYYFPNDCAHPDANITFDGCSGSGHIDHTLWNVIDSSGAPVRMLIEYDDPATYHSPQVPEPATCLMLAIGLAAIRARRLGVGFVARHATRPRLDF